MHRRARTTAITIGSVVSCAVATVPAWLRLDARCSTASTGATRGEGQDADEVTASRENRRRRKGEEPDSTGRRGDRRAQLLMAASLVMTAPLLVLFFSCQRYFIRGIIMSGIKG
jgi:hypothetical protein